MPEARHFLGFAYYSGTGVELDEAEGVRWLRLAAEQGMAGSQAAVAYAYLDGIGVEPDATESARWFRKAAEQGDSASQSWLASFYETGHGVPKDPVLAAAWAAIAAVWGDADAYLYREELFRKLTAEQYEAAIETARILDPSFDPNGM